MREQTAQPMISEDVGGRDAEGHGSSWACAAGQRLKLRLPVGDNS